MKHSNLFFFIVLLLSGCTIPVGPDIPIEENYFDWKTTSLVELEIAVPSISGEADKYYRTVNIYSTSSYTKENLILTASATPKEPLKLSFDVPSSYKRVYIEIIHPNGLVTHSSKSTSRETETKSESISTQSFPSIDIPEWGDVPSPDEMDVILDSDITKDMALVGNTNYYVPSGVNINGYVKKKSTINFWNWKGGTNAVLYIAGTLNCVDISTGKSSIVILPGGHLIVDGDLSTSTTFEDRIYIMEGGKLTCNNTIAIQGQSSMINKGEIELGNGGLLKGCYGYPEIYNSGIIYGSKSGSEYLLDAKINVDNSSTLYNSGTIYASDLNIISGGGSEIINYESGSIKTFTFDMTNKTAKCRNYGSFICEDMDAKGEFDNYSYFEAGCISNEDQKKWDVNTYDFYFKNRSGSLASIENLRLHNSTVEVEGSSILTINSLVDQSEKFYIWNTTDEYALIIVYDNLQSLTQSHSVIDGKIEVWHQELDKDGNILEEDYVKNTNYINNSYFVKNESDRVVNIPDNGINKGVGEITPPEPEVVDNDGDGVLAENDIDDDDPTIAYRNYFPNEYSYGSILVEDLWPYVGDYDMNDLVCDIKIAWTTNADNEVVYMDYYWKLRALGTTKKLAMGIQFDGVPASNVSSVTSTHTPSGNVPFNTSGGLELYQPYAVVPLFNDAEEIFGSGNNTLINTNPTSTEFPVTQESFRLYFTSPVSLYSVAVSNINPFVVITDFDNPQRSHEVHMPGFDKTSLGEIPDNSYLSRNDPFLSNTGMMWMIMTPSSIDYTIETHNIESGYSHYREWYQSFGNYYPDWYLNLPGYRDNSVIY